MLILHCDKCKSIINTTGIIEEKNRIKLLGREVDLCDSCASKVLEFIDSNEKKDEATSNVTKTAEKSNKKEVTKAKPYFEIIDEFGKDKVIQMYLNGKTSAELAELIGVSKYSMDSYFRKYNVTKLPRHSKENTENKTEESSEDDLAGKK